MGAVGHDYWSMEIDTLVEKSAVIIGDGVVAAIIIRQFLICEQTMLVLPSQRLAGTHFT